jgi:regulator of sirC expression with transglutaminase-like and TPR domain
MFAQREAILRLLEDEDEHTVSLVKSQLATHGSRAIPDLVDLLAANNETVSRHVHEVLAQIDSNEALVEFTEFCRDFPDHGDTDALEYAVFLLARAISPGIQVEFARRQLDAWAVALKERLKHTVSAETRVAVLAEFIGRDLGFHGDSEHYYRVENSLLPEVIESRVGIPISLALVYILVAARAGISVQGVSFPGHFLAKHEGVLFDPFEHGRLISITDCEAILMRQNLPLNPGLFATASARIILRRILANLMYLYQADDKKMANILSGWIFDLEKGIANSPEGEPR